MSGFWRGSLYVLSYLGGTIVGALAAGLVGVASTERTVVSLALPVAGGVGAVWLASKKLG